MLAELPSNPSIQPEIDSARQKKIKLEESIKSLKSSLSESETLLQVKTMNIEVDLALKKQIEVASVKKAIEEVEADRKRERRAERLREQRAKIQEEERAKRFKSREKQRKCDEKKEKQSGESKEERKKREFRVFLDELNAEQPSGEKKQKVADDSAQQEEQAQEEHNLDIIAQQLEEIHIEDLEQPRDLFQEDQMADQPEALQFVVPFRLPHYPPFFGPHHYRSPHPVELITPGTSVDFIKSD